MLIYPTQHAYNNQQHPLTLSMGILKISSKWQRPLWLRSRIGEAEERTPLILPRTSSAGEAGVLLAGPEPSPSPAAPKASPSICQPGGSNPANPAIILRGLESPRDGERTWQQVGTVTRSQWDGLATVQMCNDLACLQNHCF